MRSLVGEKLSRSQEDTTSNMCRTIGHSNVGRAAAAAQLQHPLCEYFKRRAFDACDPSQYLVPAKMSSATANLERPSINAAMCISSSNHAMMIKMAFLCYICV
jgi:hypothetical protein